MNITFETIKFIVLSLGLFLGFRALNKLLKLTSLKNKWLLTASRVFIFLEFSLWVLLFFETAKILFKGNATYIFIFLFIFGLILLSAFWFAVKDWIAGLVLKMEQSLAEGDWIVVDQIEGIVRHMGYRYVSLESDKNGTIILPYSLIVEKCTCKTKTTGHSEGYKFNLTIDSQSSMPGTLSDIRNAILNSPWSLAAKVPTIKHAGEDANGKLLEIVVYPATPGGGHFIEQQIKKLNCLAK